MINIVGIFTAYHKLNISLQMFLFMYTTNNLNLPLKFDLSTKKYIL